MAERSPQNLPEQPNSLVGRDRELQTAREQLLSRDIRLLTLTGPPGVGKTRLAVAVAENCRDLFPEGIWFIDLAPVQDPALVESEIMHTLGIAERQGDAALDSLAAYLRGRRILLLLDNFERVLPSAPWIARLLERTPGLKILTTSRERLRLRWERTILVPPLPLPNGAAQRDPAYLVGFPSLALFVDRAQAVNAAFTLSAENAHEVAAICHHLDGLPLAIELAAARASALSPAEILANMDDRFRLLAVGLQDLPERHQTLKAAIDWSHGALAPAERQFLRQLGVFNGSFSLSAASLIGECEALRLDALASLVALVEKSLVIRVRASDNEPRFALLESIRDYLLDRLRDHKELDDARQRHAKYYLELIERNYVEMKGAHQRAWLDMLESEHDNLRAALQWAMESGDLALGRRIAAALSIPFWWLHGHIREGLRWLEMLLEDSDPQRDETSLQILEGAGLLRAWQGDYEAGRALLLQALEIVQQREEQEEIAKALGYLGWSFWANGKTEEAAWLEESLEACSAGADPWDLAYGLVSLGSLRYEAGLDELAEKAFSKALQYFRFTEEKQQGVIFVGHKLALLRRKKGEEQQAVVEMTAALEAARQLDDLHVTVYCTADAAQLAADQMAERHIAGKPDLQKLVRVLGAVDYWREILTLPRSPREMDAHQRTIETLQQRLGRAQYLRAWQEGRSITVGRAIHEATELLETSTQPFPRAGNQPEAPDISVALSERERQVIGLVAEGLSNEDIAERLFITERTVRFHLSSIFHKFGADNRAQAVAIASRLGIV